MESFVVAIESRDILPKYEKLTSKILEEEMRQCSKVNNNIENVFAANSKNYAKRNRKLFSTNNNRNKNNSTKTTNNSNGNVKNDVYVNNISNIKCFRCGKKGHVCSPCKEKYENEFTCSLYEDRCNVKEMWKVDSAATSHMCRSREYFITLKVPKQQVVLASGESVKAEGIGNIKIKSKLCSLELKNVLYVPYLHSNFLSINKIVKAGHTVKFADNRAEMKSKNKQTILTADLVGEIFIANIKSIANFENIEVLME